MLFVIVYFLLRLQVVKNFNMKCFIDIFFTFPADLVIKCPILVVIFGNSSTIIKESKDESQVQNTVIANDNIKS